MHDSNRTRMRASNIIPEHSPRQVQRSGAMRPSINGTSKIKKAPVANGTNIQVVLRCKGNENSDPTIPFPTILEPVKSKPETEILLNTNNKTYSFDRVFHHYTQQAQVYEEVAKPILYDVFNGYSCTIFAYGQTGTGKTYTMEGDLSEIRGEHAINAGIIPRTIYNLFKMLNDRKKIEGEGSEHQVNVSMLELYNEELRDLLCASNDHKALNIFEEKDGVRVQNIKEIPISSAAEGLNIMKAGVKKRMTAPTNINEKSSRSHSIFTITVYLNEKRTDGEDVYRVGKLNLVDLAGSENSRSSGSEKVRAKEAASINRSLLTLGRVINSLVDNAQHVPYRESKLTRLLKDSLGGHTKTCIIATVAPAQQNQEEIRSTLDYASHAQGICNQPQANHSINRDKHLDSLIKNIEQLNEELRANYEKNGVYQTKKQYDNKLMEIQQLKDTVKIMQVDNSSLKTSELQIKEEANRRVESAETKLKSVEELLISEKQKKKELIAEHEKRETLLNQQYKSKLQSLEAESRQREQTLKDEFTEKEKAMEKEVQTIRKQKDECIELMIQFRKDFNRDINSKWESFISAIKNVNKDDDIITPKVETPSPNHENVVPSTSTAPLEVVHRKPIRNGKVFPTSQRKREREDEDSLPPPRPSKIRF